MTYDENNIFNHIIHKKIPAHIIYEDEYSLAFMDIMPQASGHALVICKEQAQDLTDISLHSLNSVMQTVKMLAPKIVHAMNKQGFQIRQYNGNDAGQTVYHFHVHIIPLSKGETLKGHNTQIENDDVLHQHATLIKALL